MMRGIGPRPSPISETAEAGYWACFFDQGRSTFTPWDKKGGMKIRVESHDRALLEDLQLAFGGAVTRSRAPYERQWGALTLYAWSISGQPAREMVNRVLPYLRRRRAIAEAWLKSYPNDRATGHQTVAGHPLHLVHGA
jgi:hypothetical protein